MNSWRDKLTVWTDKLPEWTGCSLKTWKSWFETKCSVCLHCKPSNFKCLKLGTVSSWIQPQSRNCQRPCSKTCVGPTVDRSEVNYHVSLRTVSVYLRQCVSRWAAVSHFQPSQQLDDRLSDVLLQQPVLLFGSNAQSDGHQALGCAGWDWKVNSSWRDSRDVSIGISFLFYFIRHRLCSVCSAMTKLTVTKETTETGC